MKKMQFCMFYGLSLKTVLITIISKTKYRYFKNSFLFLGIGIISFQCILSYELLSIIKC